MRTVETEAYKGPKYGTLNESFHLRYDLRGDRGSFQDLPDLAQEMGFVRDGNLSTKKAVWEVYDRPNHPVPNFPEGETIVSSTLALYKTGEGLTPRAILRTSTEPYPSEEFMRNLQAFTKHFVERPRILGFPSQLLSSWRSLFGGLAAGTVLLSAADYYTVQSITGTFINGGAILGEIGGTVAGGALWALSEVHARRQISDLSQYSAGNTARDVLNGERYHNVSVDIQRELYGVLQQKGVDLNPDQFLEKIYGQLPTALVQKRHTEVDQARCPRLHLQQETANTFPKLVEVAHILQAA